LFLDALPVASSAPRGPANQATIPEPHGKNYTLTYIKIALYQHKRTDRYDSVTDDTFGGIGNGSPDQCLWMPTDLRSARGIFVYLAALHHEHRTAGSVNILKWIAIEANDIGLHAWRD
jgi:hypothetical protein